MQAAPDHHRGSLRIPGYDYSQPGAYFVTICTWRKQPLFGRIVDEEMKLNYVGQVVEKQLKRLPKRFPDTRIESYVVMPDHVHMIIEIIESGRGTADSPLPNHSSEDCCAPTPSTPGAQAFRHVIPKSIPVIVRAFKSSVAYELHFIKDLQDTTIWQRNYYEHIIRDQEDWEAIHAYIEANPVNADE